MTEDQQWHCDRLVFSGHAVQQMFYRRISRDDVRSAITYGEIVEEYPKDQPYPCCLILDYVEGNLFMSSFPTILRLTLATWSRLTFPT